MKRKMSTSTAYDHFAAQERNRLVSSGAKPKTLAKYDELTAKNKARTVNAMNRGRGSSADSGWNNIQNVAKQRQRSAIRSGGQW